MSTSNLLFISYTMAFAVSGVQLALGSTSVYIMEGGTWHRHCNTSWFAKLSSPKASIVLSASPSIQTHRLYGSCLLGFGNAAATPLHLTFLRYPAFHLCARGELKIYERISGKANILWEGRCGDAPYIWPRRQLISNASDVWIWYSKEREWPQIMPYKEIEFELLMSVAQVPPNCDNSYCSNRGICAHRSADPPRDIATFDRDRELKECYCNTPYTGATCARINFAESPCTMMPCLNLGQCRLDNTKISGYVCDCIVPYTGSHCEVNTAVCPQTTDLCGLHGSCVVVEESVQCLCNTGWIGSRCDIRSPCVINPCLNRGQCVPLSASSTTCVCLPAYTGDLCQTVLSTITTTNLAPTPVDTSASTTIGSTTPKVVTKITTTSAASSSKVIPTIIGAATSILTTGNTAHKPSTSLSTATTSPGSSAGPSSAAPSSATSKFATSTPALSVPSATVYSSHTRIFNQSVGTTSIDEQQILLTEGTTATSVKLYGVTITFIVMGCLFLAFLCILFVYGWVGKAHKKDRKADMHKSPSGVPKKGSNKWRGVMELVPSQTTLNYEQNRLLMPNVKKAQKASMIAGQFARLASAHSEHAPKHSASPSQQQAPGPTRSPSLVLSELTLKGLVISDLPGLAESNIPQIVMDDKGLGGDMPHIGKSPKSVSSLNQQKTSQATTASAIGDYPPQQEMGVGYPNITVGDYQQKGDVKFASLQSENRASTTAGVQSKHDNVRNGALHTSPIAAGSKAKVLKSDDGYPDDSFGTSTAPAKRPPLKKPSFHSSSGHSSNSWSTIKEAELRDSNISSSTQKHTSTRTNTSSPKLKSKSRSAKNSKNYSSTTSRRSPYSSYKTKSPVSSLNPGESWRTATSSAGVNNRTASMKTASPSQIKAQLLVDQADSWMATNKTTTGKSELGNTVDTHASWISANDLASAAMRPKFDNLLRPEQAAAAFEHRRYRVGWYETSPLDSVHDTIRSGSKGLSSFTTPPTTFKELSRPTGSLCKKTREKNSSAALSIQGSKNYKTPPHSTSNRKKRGTRCECPNTSSFTFASEEFTTSEFFSSLNELSPSSLNILSGDSATSDAIVSIEDMSVTPHNDSATNPNFSPTFSSFSPSDIHTDTLISLSSAFKSDPTQRKVQTKTFGAVDTSQSFVYEGTQATEPNVVNSGTQANQQNQAAIPTSASNTELQEMDRFRRSTHDFVSKQQSETSPADD